MQNKEISIGAIYKRLDKKFFNPKSSDPFELNCSKREDTLIEASQKAISFVYEHIRKPEIAGKLTHWQEAKIERNIKNLIKYMELLHTKLEKDEILKFCSTKDTVLPICIEEDHLLLLINSYYVTVVYDILWASDISVSDLINISNGTIDSKNLEVKLPNLVSTINDEIIPFLNLHNEFEEFIPKIEDSIESFKNDIRSGASLLIITVLEGMVRKLGNNLITEQGLNPNLLKKKFNSLDSYLRNIPWKEDIKYDRTRLMFITGDYVFKNERTPEDNNGVETINLKLRLDFLRRSFKKERDMTLHGNLKNIGETWDLYRNYSALYEVYLTIRYYKELKNNS